uniref:Uncharacterized protein n=1 Tax=Pristionchus pacificus TaxID=54126 RepID=A0A2A6CI10_PRIPA|eukprot:PDM77855.1 hypothetical protein PRIPAC_34722 [Pristionchus pacificus]
MKPVGPVVPYLLHHHSIQHEQVQVEELHVRSDCRVTLSAQVLNGRDGRYFSGAQLMVLCAPWKAYQLRSARRPGGRRDAFSPICKEMFSVRVKKRKVDPAAKMNKPFDLDRSEDGDDSRLIDAQHLGVPKMTYTTRLAVPPPRPSSGKYSWCDDKAYGSGGYASSPTTAFSPPPPSWVGALWKIDIAMMESAKKYWKVVSVIPNLQQRRVRGHALGRAGLLVPGLVPAGPGSVPGSGSGSGPVRRVAAAAATQYKYAQLQFNAPTCILGSVTLPERRDFPVGASLAIVVHCARSFLRADRFSGQGEGGMEGGVGEI